METNSLNLNVKSDTVEKGADRLDRLSRSAAKAERESKGLATATGKASNANAKFATETGRAGGAQRSFVKATKEARKATDTYRDANGRLRDSKGRYAKSELAAARATQATSKAQRGATGATRALTGATAGLGATLGTVLAPLLAILTPILALKKLLGSTVELQDFQAQLKTATGPIENAGVAFEVLEDFASTTPYALEQSLDAFIKLTNLGLTPSERALTSYGNTASAMGKDLTQLIEAVADATTGEFERLKEFGIKASSEGDRVTFTFRGVATEVGKNAAEIEEYLTNLGENEFAGAMSDRMNTVGGQISNLGDLWNQLFRTISELGVGSVIGATIQIGIDLLSEMIAMLESGQFEAALESWTAGFEGWADDFGALIELVSSVFSVETNHMAEDGQSVWTTFIDALKLVPALVRYYIQRIAIEIVALGQYGAIAGKAIYQGLKIYLESSVNAAVEAAKAIGNALLSPIDTFNNGGINFSGVGAATAAGADKIGGIISNAEDAINATRQSRIDSLGEIDSQLDASATKVVKLRNESEDLRAAYEKEKAAKDAARGLGDRLEGFKVGGTGGGATGGSSLGGGRSGGSSRASSGPSEFDNLVDELQRQERAIEESYLKRLQLVRDNTDAGSEIRLELEEKLLEEYDKETEAFAEKSFRELDISRDRYDTEIQELTDFYQKRKDIILESTALTEEEKSTLIARLEKERSDTQRKAEIERWKQSLDTTQDFLKDLEQASKLFGERGAKIAKAAAIANATIDTARNAILAYQRGLEIPIVGPYVAPVFAATAVAAGAAQIATIKSQNVGNYANGGILGGPSATGDALQFNGNSGEVVMNFEQQRRLLNIANGAAVAGSNQGSGKIVIINQSSNQIEQGETRVNANGDREIIIRDAVNRTKAELANEADTGGGQVIPALQRNFNLRRIGT